MDEKYAPKECYNVDFEKQRCDAPVENCCTAYRLIAREFIQDRIRSLQGKAASLQCIFDMLPMKLTNEQDQAIYDLVQDSQWR